MELFDFLLKLCTLLRQSLRAITHLGGGLGVILGDLAHLLDHFEEAI